MSAGRCLLVSVLSLLVVLQSTDAVNSEQLDELWTNYKLKFHKKYDPVEDQYRQRIWESKVNSIQLHNVRADLGLQTYTRGINQFTDWTLAEYRKTVLGFRAPLRTNSSASNDVHYYKYDVTSLPDKLDWRTKGYVTPVKDQGQCGSCWAFSSTGSLEGQNFKKTGKLVSLSEQNLVDCTKSLGNEGCSGGWMNASFIYVAQNHGIDTEESYPYEAEDGDCRFNPATVGGTCTGSQDVTPAGDESALQTAVATIGPISVAIDAGHNSFQSYQSGVYDEPACTDNVDHGVLVVGYGSDNGQDYWLVKNSWSTSWGDQGYIKMSRNKDNQCGIASFAVYPTM
jgi:cathepsin L